MSKTGFKTKLYDRYTSLVGGLLSTFSPVLAGRFVSNRHMYRAFAAGMQNDAEAKFAPRLRSGDAEVKRAYKLVAARCRDQAENNSLISGGIGRICDNVVRNGIFPKFRFRDASGKLDREVNEKWRAGFMRWSRYCEITGHDTYGGTQRLGLRHMWSDGQYLIHRVYDTSMPDVVPLRLELIEFDQLDALVDGVLPGGNIARKGIEYDPLTARPVAYHLLDHHPGDYLALGSRSNTRRIPASEIIHVWDRRRISQCSGISWLVAVVMEAYRMEDFRHITQDAARIQTIFGAFLKSAFPGFQLGGGLSFGGQTNPSIKPGDTGATDAPTEIKGPTIQRLPNSTELQFTPPAHPGNNYEPFVKDSQRWQSAGMGMSFEAFANNYTDSSYASARSGSLEERLSYRGQQQFIEEQVNRAVLAWYIDAAYLSRLAPVPMKNYARDPRLYQEMAEGQYPGWQWVDPNADAQAAEKLIGLTLDNHANQAAQRGTDWWDNMELLKEETVAQIELEQLRMELNQLKGQHASTTQE